MTCKYTSEQHTSHLLTAMQQMIGNTMVPFIYYVSTFNSTKLTLTLTKTGFFRQDKRIFFSTLHFYEIFMLYFRVFSKYIKKKKNAQKNCENVAVDNTKKHAYILYEWSLSIVMLLYNAKRKLFKSLVLFWHLLVPCLNSWVYLAGTQTLLCFQISQ